MSIVQCDKTMLDVFSIKLLENQFKQCASKALLPKLNKFIFFIMLIKMQYYSKTKTFFTKIH